MSDSKFPKGSKRKGWSFLKTRERRMSRREPIAKIYVEIRRSADSEIPDWAGTAVDVNSNGMALVLPPDMATGTRVSLSFALGEVEFSCVPAEVVRQDVVGVGAVRFVDWSDADQLELLAYLETTDGPTER